MHTDLGRDAVASAGSVLESEESNTSRLGFGAGPLKLVGNHREERDAVYAVHRAIDLGISLFDVSPYYGPDRAEEVLGKALAGRRDRVELCTKAGRIGDDNFDFSRSGIRRSLEASLRRLRTDHVDILLAHDVEFGLPEQILGETIDTLEQLKSEGLCRAIGISAYPIPVLRRVIENRSIDVVLSYCHYCLFNTDLMQLVPLTRSRGVRVINGSPLGMGLLAGDAPLSHPAPPALHDACRVAEEFCASRGQRLASHALRFALDAPGIETTLVGMSTTEFVESNVAVAAADADTEILASLMSIFEPVNGVTWTSGRAGWSTA